jgi:peptidoglycan/xylan/chitin deacetylase (PgdA/CDA1 family)
MTSRPRILRFSARLGFSAAARVVPARRCAPRSLMYHSVDDSGSLLSISPKNLRLQLAWLRQNDFTGLTADEFIAAARSHDPAPNTIFITFDDGYQNLLTDGVPLLQEFNFSATVFIPTDFVGSTIDAFRREYPSTYTLGGAATTAHSDIDSSIEHCAALPVMTWDEIARAKAAGVDIQSHSAAHHVLPRLAPNELADDLARSRAAIENHLGHRADLICYPYGACTAKVAAAAAHAGYSAGVLGDRFAPPRNVMQLARVGVNDSITTDDLAYLLSSAADCEAALRRRLRPAPSHEVQS